MATELYVSLSEVSEALRSIDSQMQASNWFPDIIVGITKGGAVPVTMLSHMLGQKPVTKYLTVSECEDFVLGSYEGGWDGKSKVLFVDDILDSSKTINSISSKHTAVNPYIKYATLIENVEALIKVDYSGIKINRSTQPLWYQFFWE